MLFFVFFGGGRGSKIEKNASKTLKRAEISSNWLNICNDIILIDSCMS